MGFGGKQEAATGRSLGAQKHHRQAEKLDWSPNVCLTVCWAPEPGPHAAFSASPGCPTAENTVQSTKVFLITPS